MSKKQIVSKYVPSEDMQRRSIKTPENIRYLQDRLSQNIRATSPRKSYQDFLDDVTHFIVNVSCQPALDSSHRISLDPDRLGKFIRDDRASKVVTEIDFKCICYFLDWKGLFYNNHRGADISAAFVDPLFHSVLDFMKIGEFTLNNMKRHAPGFYRCYRPASTFPGNFWVGAMEVFEERASGALITMEFYQSAGFDQRPNKTVELSGYLFRKGRHYTIISRNESSTSLSVALLPSVSIENHKITNLTGAVLDMSTGHLWGGRVIYDRVELPARCVGSADNSTISVDSQEMKKLFFDSAMICTADEIPKSVLHHFQNDPIPNLRMF